MAAAAWWSVEAAKKAEEAAKKKKEQEARERARKGEAIEGQAKEQQLKNAQNSGQTYVPATNPEPVEPFLTPEQAMEFIQNKGAYEEKLKAIGYALNELKANTEYEAKQVDKRGKAEHHSAEWNLAGRGLEHSSIRDADLYDIDATSAIQQQFLHDNLTRAEERGHTEVTEAENRWNKEYLPAVDALKVQNAQGITPTPGTAAHWEGVRQTPINTKPPTVNPPKKEDKHAIGPGHAVGNTVRRGEQAGLTGVHSSNGAITAPTGHAATASALMTTRPPKILGKISG